MVRTRSTSSLTAPEKPDRPSSNKATTGARAGGKSVPVSQTTSGDAPDDSVSLSESPPRSAAAGTANTAAKDHSAKDHSATVAHRILQQLETIQLRLDEAATEPPASAETLADRTGLQLELLRSDLNSLTEAVREELRSGLQQLQSAQAEASGAQGEILRTLTEAIVTSAAASRDSAGDLEMLLSRMESRLEDRLTASIRETLQQVQLPQTAESSAVARADSTPAAAPTAGRNAAMSAASGSSSRTWDEIRRAFLNDSTDLSDTAPAISTAATLAAGLTATATAPVIAEEPETPLELPRAVDLSLLTDVTLRDAFVARDELISTLVARLRQRTEARTTELSAEQLRQLASSLPDDLAERVRQTLQRMDDQLRLSELELSLERARISRQVSQLEHSRQQLEHNARQLGWTVNPDGTLSSGSSAAVKGSGSRRWLGKLGFSE